MNIFSGEKGLGGALTNPTELAKRKGNIAQSYPVNVEGKHFPDAEAAYHFFKCGDATADDEMMTCLIALKLKQHPRLFEAIAAQGGVAWLETCSHITYAKTPSAASWEGQGRESRFIRNLIAGFERVQDNGPTTWSPQGALF